MTCDAGVAQRLERDQVGHVDADRLAVEAALAQLELDLLRQARPGRRSRRGIAPRIGGDAGAEALRRQPRGEELVVAGGGAEVPEDRVVAARQEHKRAFLSRAHSPMCVLVT